MRPVRIVVFDSGLGGLTVYRELRLWLPEADYIYVADRAAFPYGDWQEDALVEHVVALFGRLIARERPDICVIACNTASTVVLKPLRARFDMPFVGTVPAVKVAAERTRTGLFSVLATPGTVKRDYTHDLIREFAQRCAVTLVGTPRLAGLAEAYMRGKPIDDAELWREIAPAFVAMDDKRTDTIVLACTHFPLLQQELERIAPWPVNYIDPAPAIAKRTEQVLRERGALSDATEWDHEPQFNRFLTTDDKPVEPELMRFLRSLGLARTEWADWLLEAPAHPTLS